MTDTVRLAVAGISVDADRFQFKASDGDGVTAEMRDVAVFDPDAEGVVSVWEDPNDGQTVYQAATGCPFSSGWFDA